jgi:AraC family transcriptional activator of tynA and feaB
MHDVAIPTKPAAGAPWRGTLDPALSAYIPISVDRSRAGGRLAPERTAVSEWDDVVCADFAWFSRSIMRAPVTSQDPDDAYVVISLVHGGSARVVAGTTTGTVGRGDLFLWDSCSETRMAIPSFLQMSTVLIPRLVLARAALAGSPLSLEQLGGSAAAPMLKHLLQAVRETPPGPSCARRLRNAMVEGVLAVLEPARLSDSAALLPGLRRAARAYIEQHVDDPDLSLRSIASANAVSVRTLSRAFEGEPQTVAQLIRLRRLERARDLLATGDLSVTSISDRLDFANPSHFARVFSRTYGLSPREYRERQAAASTPIQTS